VGGMWCVNVVPLVLLIGPSMAALVEARRCLVALLPDLLTVSITIVP